MKKQIFKLLIVGAFSGIAISCSCSNETDEAKKHGENDAQELINSLPMSDMRLQEKLLEVRSEEYLYRSKGNEEAAEEYVKAFTDYIKLHNDSLAGVMAIK